VSWPPRTRRSTQTLRVFRLDPLDREKAAP
jgi:hypothetical protein